MKPLSVEMACLLGIQNEIQAVWTISQPFYSVNSLLITHSSDRSRGKPELKPGGVVGGSISKSRTESDQSGNFFCRLRMYNSLKEVSCYLYFC